MRRHSDSFLITVNTLVGSSFSIVVEISDSVYNLKERIAGQEGIETCNQHLLFGSNELCDDDSLDEVGLYHGAELTLVVSMKVGPLKTKSVQIDTDNFVLDDEIEYEFEFEGDEDDDDDDDDHLLLVQYNGVLYLYQAPKASYLYGNSVQQRRPAPSWNRERFYENAVTKEKMNSLKKQMDVSKKMKQVKPDTASRSARTKTVCVISARPKTGRMKTPRTYRKSHTYENAMNNVNLLKAEIYLQGKRNKQPGKPPYTHSQLVQFVRAKIAVLLEEQRLALGENPDYLPRPKSLVPTVVVRPPFASLTASTSSSETSCRSNRIEDLYRDNNATTIPEGPITARRLDICVKACSGRNAKTLNVVSKLSSARLVKKHKASKSSVKRCAECRKKLSVVNEYECRCGQFFCSTHRYAETHKCTFDYKEEGRRILKEANPLITAPKVPQI